MNSRLDQSKKPDFELSFPHRIGSPGHARLYEVDNDTFLYLLLERLSLSRTRKQMQSLSEQLYCQDKMSCMFYPILSF